MGLHVFLCFGQWFTWHSRPQYLSLWHREHLCRELGFWQTAHFFSGSFFFLSASSICLFDLLSWNNDWAASESNALNNRVTSSAISSEWSPRKIGACSVANLSQRFSYLKKLTVILKSIDIFKHSMRLLCVMYHVCAFLYEFHALVC